MTKLHILYKIVENNRVVGCTATDGNKKIRIPKDNLNNFVFDNAKITSDNKIIGDIPSTYITKQVEKKEVKGKILTLYHGSHNGIQGKINCKASRATCDFGQGFYTGDTETQAKALLIDDSNGTFYTLKANLEGLKIYKFKEDIDWALFVGANRGKISLDSYPKLRKIVNSINGYDVIVGKIADDRMAYVYKRFIENAITDIALVEALQYVNFGDQYVFKTQKACDRIKIVSTQRISAEEQKLLKHEKNLTIGNLEEIVENIRVRNLKNGRYIHEVLEKFV